MNPSKTILITGSNKGIGFGLIEELLLKATTYNIILTSRNVELGTKAFNRLSEKYPSKKQNLFYHQLDITDSSSVVECNAWIKTTFKQLDYWVNNAGVASKGSTFNIDVCNATFSINVDATLSYTEQLIKEDLIAKNGKIILVGSCAGFLSKLTNPGLVTEFKTAKTVQDWLSLEYKFKQSIINDTVEKDGWPKNTYSVSKMIVNTYAKVWSYNTDIISRNISVYACHPGWIKTDMAGPEAPLTIKEGVQTQIYLIELPNGIVPELQGGYFSESQLKSYYY